MVSGYSTSTSLPWVDGLSTDPRDLGCHGMAIVRHELVIHYALFQVNWLYFFVSKFVVLDFVIIIIYLIGKRAKLCK